MRPKSETSKEKPEAVHPPNAFAPFAQATLMRTAWFEGVAELGSEIASFVAERIREDMKTRHALLHCKSLPEMQKIQAEFLQKAFDQYQAETGKLVEMTDRMAVGILPKDDPEE